MDYRLLPEGGWLPGTSPLSATSGRSLVFDEGEVLRRLRAGDEEAFAALVERHHAAMIRLALSFVRSHAVAEEVVQDTWLGFLRGLDRFEGRSSLQTWLYSILVNRARTTGARERRSTPVADEGWIEEAWFRADGGWATPPAHWADDVDDRLSAPELTARIGELIGRLPDGPRQVITLRDIEGLSSTDVCQVLGITEGNQRVLLHRARSRIRRVLADEAGRW
jgi:RNA polymerase sigma-70 factor, ECF subfamily